MIIIVLGNGMVIVAIAVDRNLKSEQNWFIASLAVSDLLVGLLIMPLSLANELMGYWFFGTILCELWLATDVLLCTASILNLCLISLDRYWSITRAISYIKQRTQKKAIIMVTVVWLLSMIICFPPLVGWKRPQGVSEYGLPLCQLTDDLGYVVYSTLGSFYIPLIVMVVVYIKIYIAARSRARRNLKKRKATAQAKKQQEQKRKENGQKISTSTTSFTGPACEASKMEDDLDTSSHEEISEYPANLCVSTTNDTTCSNVPSDYNIPLQGMASQNKATDERRRLLADDTDSAGEMPTHHNRHAMSLNKLSEETDSPCEQTDVMAKEKYNGSVSEENTKPLLEDSQLESDSQRECEHNLPLNNNNAMTPTAKSHHDRTATKVNGNRDPKASSGKPQEKHKGLLLTPSGFRPGFSGLRHKHNAPNREKPKRVDDPEKAKRRIARAKERRATIVLGIIMATFILCWLPFFSTYLISSLTGAVVPEVVFDVFFWAGYCNSGLNPVIYTIFNRDFRHAFQRILCGKRRWK